MAEKAGKRTICLTALLLMVLSGQLLAMADQASAVIIMDADTGQVLRLENAEIAVETGFPPGSLIKPFSALYGLKEHIISPSFTVDCKGELNVNGEKLDCWRPSGHGPLNFYKAVAYSCNVYFYYSSHGFDAGGFHRFLRSVGFGRKTGIDLPNEDAGKVPLALDTVEKAKVAAGSSRNLRITPIQAITAFAAIVNGGKLLKPWKNKGGTIVREDLNLALQLPLLHRALKEASTYGTSRGYFQATAGFAKTGTGPWAAGFHTHGWFVGFLPLQNRRVVLLVFKIKGTGARDALPAGIQLAKELKKRTEDQQIVNASLFSLLKPRSMTIQGRFGSLLIKNGVGEDIRCGKIEVKHLSNCDIKVRIDGVDTGAHQTLAIRNSHPNGFLNLKVNKMESRDYSGRLTLRSNSDYLDIINTISLKEYLEGVMGNEMSHPLQALKTQAVVSRTYALKNLERHDTFDFCDTTHCQHYTGRQKVSAMIRQAVKETSGLALTYNSDLCEVFCHSTCGGVTNDFKGVWNDKRIPYLKSIYNHNQCSASPHFRWQFEIKKSQLFEILKEMTGDTPVDLHIVETGNGGWVKRIKITLSNSRETVWRGERFHILMGRRLGWNTIKSANFTLHKEEKKWLFSGKGLGHGLGLCQWGARVMAEKGVRFREILKIYFPGTVVDSDWSLVNGH